MSSGQTIICLDALGADDAPGVCLNGAKLALEKDPNLIIELCGPEDVVVPFCKDNDRCNPVITTQSISMAEHPAMAVRKKKDSGIVVGCKRVKENKADGFFSGGNTGACLAAATLVTGRIRGVDRPMLTAAIPNIKGGTTLFGDVGANADCKPEYLLQFGQMAAIFLQEINNNNQAKIGLLNIGEEDKKGSKLALEANKLMRDNISNFAGNAEGRDLLSGEFDAIISDGFTGNVALKTMEGTLKSMLNVIEASIMSSTKSKIGGLLIKSSLKNTMSKFSTSDIGGAVLLGIDGSCVVGHGSSDAQAICNGVLLTAEIVRKEISSKIANKICESN